MLQQAPMRKPKNSIPEKEVEKWLEQNGNGMAKLQKDSVKNDKFWKWHEKEPVAKMIDRYFDSFDVLVPSEIKDTGLARNIRIACERKVKAGELVKFTTPIKSNDPMRASKPRNFLAYRRK